MNRVAKLHFHLHPFVLVIIAGFGNRHLEYFIQDVDGDAFDRVSTLVRVDAHPGKILKSTTLQEFSDKLLVCHVI